MGVALATKGSRAPLVYACVGKNANEKEGRRTVRGIKMNGMAYMTRSVEIQAECRRSKVKHYVSVIAHVHQQYIIHKLRRVWLARLDMDKSSHDIL